MKQKKKIVYSCIALLLACACFIAAPNVSAKYVLDSTGTAWQLIFSAFEIVTDAFIIGGDTNGDGTFTEDDLTSNHLWGKGVGENGEVDAPGGWGAGDYGIGNESTAEFSALNQLDEDMLITFYVEITLPDLGGLAFLNSSLSATVTNTATNESVSATLKVSPDETNIAEVQLTKGDKQFQKIFQYYLYTATINPQAVLNDEEDTSAKNKLEALFVLSPGEVGNYTITLQANGGLQGNGINLGSVYVSIKMIAAPYTPAS